MGGGGVARGGRPPSHIAYYVALAGILSLLLLLCCYFIYFFIKKIREISQQESPTTPTAPRLPNSPPAYPIQPVVRESATAMAKLCKQIPTTGGKGDTVFPTSTSPEAMRTGGSPPAPASQPALATDNEKIPTNITNTDCVPTEVASS